MLAVIIVSYKSDAQTIDFVQKQCSKISTPNIIIIVNNGASLESSNFLCEKLDALLILGKEQQADKHYRYIIHNTENVGFAKGNNIGAEFAYKKFNIEYILFTNNDIVFLETNVVEKLISRISEIPKAGLIGPKVIGLDQKLQSPEPFVSFWDYYANRVWLGKKSYKCKIQKYIDDAIEGFHYKIMGSFFIIKKDCFIECGGFDDCTFLYFEEVILSERLKAIGKGCYFYPMVSVLHEHGKTIKKYNSEYRMSIINLKSGQYYYKKYINTNRFVILLGTFLYKVKLYLKFIKCFFFT